jgi:hypothetical protein
MGPAGRIVKVAAHQAEGICCWGPMGVYLIWGIAPSADVRNNEQLAAAAAPEVR